MSEKFRIASVRNRNGFHKWFLKKMHICIVVSLQTKKHCLFKMRWRLSQAVIAN